MKSNQNMNTVSSAKIVGLTIAAFKLHFNPGKQADRNWVTKCLYEHQECLKEQCLTTDLEKDVVRVALEINPDTTAGGVSSEDYESAMLVINPRRAQFRALTANNIDM